MSTSALVVIDVQANMFDPSSPVKAAAALLSKLTLLLERSRARGVPVIFVRNCGGPGDPDQPGSAGWELHPALQPREGESIIDKTTTNSFANTSLDAELKKRRVSHLVIAGLQSEFCVKATVAAALALGYEVTLVSDGHSTYDGKKKSAEQITEEVNTGFRGRVDLEPAASISFK